ncbi:MAG: HEPN domain-containing protein [Candidatus Omnitrophica bacterium]|nr:HEPN domain-containing protein [Candidatus Omnitrophota bacterium]
MKKSKNSTNIKDWLRVTKADFVRAKKNLKENDLPVAEFFLQQSLEKYLKGFLIKHGWELKKINELDALLDEALKYKPELSSYYELCERVSGYYLAERYPPFDDLGLTSKILEKDVEEAKLFIKTLFPEEELK